MNRYRHFAWSLLTVGLLASSAFAETTTATAAVPGEATTDVPGRLHTVARPPISLQRAYDWAQKLDAHVMNRLKQESLTASPRADDAEFLRRVSLDITGRIPSADTVRAFLDNPDPDKRRKIIEAFLADSGYGRQQADRWATQLLPRESNNRRLSREPLETFLADRFNRNQPWNLLVTDLLTASGLQDETGLSRFSRPIRRRIKSPTP